MKTLSGIAVFIIAGIAFLQAGDQESYLSRLVNKDKYVLLRDTVPKNKQDTSSRPGIDSLNKYKRDTFNRKDSFIKRRDSL